MSKIVVKIGAALGNQLFMFANAFALSKIKKSTLIIDDKSSYFRKKEITLDRVYGLNKFNIPQEYFSNKNFYNNFFSNFLRKVFIFFDKFKKKKKFLIEHKINKIKTTNFKEINLENYTSNIEIEGHYECEKYFLNHRKDLQKLLIPNINLFNNSQKKLHDKYKLMLVNSNSISIHVRCNGYFGPAQTNYKKLDEIKVSSQILYIQKGISYFNKTIDEPKFFVWSNNINLVKEHFDNKIFTFIETSDKICDFSLFQYCKHFIVSPSTFHWMGAWLNDNSKKICIRPENMTPSNNLDFWPNKWIKL